MIDLVRRRRGILTGVGFIGGGAILKKGDLVTGVTTAAMLWLITVSAFVSAEAASRLAAYRLPLESLPFAVLKMGRRVNLAATPGGLDRHLRIQF